VSTIAETHQLRFLSPSERDSFVANGFLMLPNAIDASRLRILRSEFDAWVEESRQHDGSYGETIDKRPRFSVEPGHNAQRPGLRRIASPNELSPAYLDVMRNNRALDAVTDLFGPDIQFCNSKINSKLPGVATAVKFHQDFLFELHSNDSLMTVLFFLDDVTHDNGPLDVVPGSHLEALHEHWHDGVFTGAVSAEVAEDAARRAVSCTGPAGSACLMHTRLLHASAPNRSDRARTLFICSYAAEDAIPLHDNHIPSVHMGEIVRGTETGRVRSSVFDVRIPDMPKGASFFEQQSAES